jgi:hypothetical protein
MSLAFVKSSAKAALGELQLTLPNLFISSSSVSSGPFLLFPSLIFWV